MTHDEGGRGENEPVQFWYGCVECGNDYFISQEDKEREGYKHTER